MKMTGLEVGGANAASRLERLPVCGYHRMLFLVIALAFFFDNVDLATMTFVLGSIKNEFGLSSAEAGMLGSASFAGMAAGALCSGAAADRFGRKPVFQVSMIVWGIGSLLCASATNATSLGIFRLVLGIGMGMELPLAQTLLSEFIPARSRGRYLAMMDGNWPLAFISAGLLSYFVLDAYGWRTLFLIEAIPAIFLFVVRRYVPESPRWLESRGRYLEAGEIVDRIERSVMSRLGLPALPEALPMVAEARNEQGIRVLWSRGYRQRTLTIGSLWFFALLGFYGLNTWLGALLQQSGLAVTRSVLFTIYISLGGVPGFLWAAWAVERWGRKTTCVITLVGAAVMIFAFGRISNVGLQQSVLVAVGALMQFFAFGMWAVLYTYTPELYPSRARASGCGFASFAGRIGALAGPTIVGLILPAWKYDGVFVFGAACFVVAALVVMFFGIETRGSTLEEVSG
ncbi:MFS transporter [Burkholderia anthina]|uniref:MFS transporter n=1 Tax=Burkholderia anthina TaxID=179879 RepID=UPI001AA0A17A|nr:MFS transporter [Burkholderia anthina]QTD95000.1 MFS transporter [Burkholderia anthina]